MRFKQKIIDKVIMIVDRIIRETPIGTYNIIIENSGTNHSDYEDQGVRIQLYKRRYPTRTGSMITFTINGYHDSPQSNYSPVLFRDILTETIRLHPWPLTKIEVEQIVPSFRGRLKFEIYRIRPDGTFHREPHRHVTRLPGAVRTAPRASRALLPETASEISYIRSPSATSSGAFDMPAYRAPSIEKSHFRSSVKTGSRSLHSSNYTGSGSHKKLRNGILQTELENTASSHPKMVYVKGDPTRLLAPMESWKRLPGQLHPLTRQPLGHSNLRKVKNIASSLGAHKTIGKKIIKKRR